MPPSGSTYFLRRPAAALAVVLLLFSVSSPAFAGNWQVNSGPASGGGAARAGTLAAPTGVTASCTSYLLGTAYVSWNAVPHATSYAVEVYGGGSYLGTASASGTSWTLGGALLQTGSFQFAVAAEDYSWQGPFSQPLTSPSISIVLGVTCT